MSRSKHHASGSIVKHFSVVSVLISLLPICGNAQNTTPEYRALITRQETYPNLSPDSRTLIYTSGSGFALNLFSLDIETQKVTQVTDSETEDSAASWSPSGRKIVIQREDSTGFRDIWELDFENGSERNLTNTPEINEQHPRYASSDTEIVFDSDRASVGSVDSEGDRDNYEIYSMSLETNDLRRLTTWDRWDMYPSFSPDQSRLSWRRDVTAEGEEGRNFDIFVKDLATGQESNLTNHEAVDTNPHWSPSGEWIVFTSNRSGSYELHVIKADGTDLRQITNGGSVSIGYVRPSFSGDGTKVVANRIVRGVTDMVIIEFPGDVQTSSSQNPD